jgi:hypothetical protein
MKMDGLRTTIFNFLFGKASSLSLKPNALRANGQVSTDTVVPIYSTTITTQGNDTPIETHQAPISQADRPSVAIPVNQKQGFLSSRFPVDYKSFPDRIDERIECRFKDFLARVHSSPFFPYMRKKYPKCFIHFRLMALGRDSDNTEFYIVVMCDEDKIKRAQKFFTKEYSKLLSASNDPTQPQIKIEFYGGKSISTAAGNIPVKAGGPKYLVEKFRGTLCGTLVTVDDPEVTSFATVGGLIDVTFSGMKTKSFALTVGHLWYDLDVMEKYASTTQPYSLEWDTSSDNDSSDESSKSVKVEEPKPYGFVKTPKQSIPRGTGGPFVTTDVTHDGWHWFTLGAISEASCSERASNRDWALIEEILPEFKCPNRLPYHYQKSTVPFSLKEVEKAAGILREEEDDDDDDNASGKFHEVYIVCNDTLRKGILSRSWAASLLPSGAAMVRVYTLSVTDTSGNYFTPPHSSY